jgi:hypothetical protein
MAWRVKEGTTGSGDVVGHRCPSAAARWLGRDAPRTTTTRPRTRGEYQHAGHAGRTENRQSPTALPVPAGAEHRRINEIGKPVNPKTPTGHVCSGRTRPTYGRHPVQRAGTPAREPERCPWGRARHRGAAVSPLRKRRRKDQGARIPTNQAGGRTGAVSRPAPWGYRSSSADSPLPGRSLLCAKCDAATPIPLFPKRKALTSRGGIPMLPSFPDAGKRPKVKNTR